MSVYDGEKLLEIPLPSPLIDETVYHYTASAGLIGIVESGSFWASSPAALNDLSEIEYGIAIFQSAWKRMKDEGDIGSGDLAFIDQHLSFESVRASLSQIYLVCASRELDSLNQWQNYTEPPGYSLGISTKRHLGLLIPSETENVDFWKNAGPRISDGWYEVIYNRAQQERLARDILQWVLDTLHLHSRHPEYLLDYVAPLVPQMKHPSFKAEREVRFISYNAPGFPENFRAGAYGVTPYVILVPTTERRSYISGDSRTQLSIESLTCGPVNDGERGLVRTAAERLLARYNYGHVPVGDSEVPYRIR